MWLPTKQTTREMLLLLVLPALTAVCFQSLVMAPDALVVDAERPSVDHADRGHVRGIGNDLTTVFLPRFQYVVDKTRENGKWPLWDPTGFGGRPLVGNPQAGLFYPLIWVAQYWGNASSLCWLTVGHLLFGGVGVYVLTRRLGYQPLAAVVAGGCFEASPYLIAHTFEGHYPHVWSACWYPWAFWAMEMATKRKAAGFWLLPVILALTFLTGHPQEWYYLVVALTIWVLAGATRDFRRGEAAQGMGRVLCWGGLLGLSLAFCALELGPELAAGPWILKRSVIPLAQVNRYHLHGLNLFQLLSPFALGRPDSYAGHDNYWETVLSIGLAPLCLAIVGVLKHANRQLMMRWLVVVILSVLFAAGRKLGLYSLVYEILPGMDRFRVPSRTLFLASLGASILAGGGVDALLREDGQGIDWGFLRTRLRGGLISLGVVVLILPIVLPKILLTKAQGGLDEEVAQREARAARTLATSPIFWLSLVGVVGVVTIAGRAKGGRHAAAWGLGTVALVELAVYGQALLICAPVSSFLGGAEVGGVLSVIRNDSERLQRVASIGSALPDLRAVAEGVEKTNINDGFQIQHAADLYERLYAFLDPATPEGGKDRPMDGAVSWHRGRMAKVVLDQMSARYVVAGGEGSVDELASLERVATTLGKSAVWRNRGSLPRAFVVPNVRVSAGGGGDPVATVAGLDVRREVLMGFDPLPPGPRQEFMAAGLNMDDPDEPVVSVATEAPGLLVLGNTWMPGWTATVDGEPAEVHRGNHWAQVVAIRRAGRHEVVFKYQPPGYTTGMAVALVSILGWAGLGVLLVGFRVRELGWARWLSAGWTLFTPSRASCESTIRG